MDYLNALVLLTNFIIIPALAYGSQLALGALGVTLVYAVLRFSNFAHGETMAFGTMFTILGTWGLQSANISFGPLPTALLALPLGMAVTALFVLGTDRLVYRHYRRHKAVPVIFMIASVGVMFIMNGLVRFIIGPQDQNFADGERFIFTAGEFREWTGLAGAAGTAHHPGCQHRKCRHCRGCPVLVPEPDPNRKIHARLFGQ